MEAERQANDPAQVPERENPAGGAGETRLAAIVESILFASGEPITLRRLVEILNGPSQTEVREALARIAQQCAREDRGVRLVEVADGYQLRTARENAEWVRAVFRERPRRLGRAALETLAIIAYRGPITRAEVEAVRGVDIEGVLSTLIRRGVVKVCGRKEAVGRPLLYGTTDEFLDLFGLRNLSELPTLRELPAAAGVCTDGESTIELTGGTATEVAEPGRSGVTAEGGGVDPGGPSPREWTGSDGTRGESGSRA